MSTADFLHLRLIGARFDDHSIPLALIRDIAVLEEMIVEVAKHRFLADHPERRRTPRGFTKNIDLRLAAIGSGSAVLDIRLAHESRELFAPTNQRYVEQARDAVMETVRAAEQDRVEGRDLPDATLSYFDRLGRSLKGNEAVEFIHPDRKDTATLTQEVRRRLVLASPKVNEYTEDISIRGLISEMDQHDNTFKTQLSNGRIVSAPIPIQHFDTTLEAFRAYRSRRRVLLQGIGRFSRSGHLLGFDSIEHVSTLDALDIGVQIDDLRLLKDGWLDGDGDAPSPDGLSWLLDVFERRYPDDAPLPYLYPTETGGVQVEWSLGTREASLEVDVDSHSAVWHVLDLQSKESEERTLSCDSDDDWMWLLRQIGSVDRGRN